MEKILYSEIMVICSMVLILIWRNDVRKSKGPMLVSQRLFQALLAMNIFAMTFDAITIVFDSTNYPFSNTLMWAGIFLYYVVHGAVGFFFLLYVDFELYPDEIRLKRRLPYYMILEVVLVYMNIASFWTGWFFVIDENSKYIRGSLFYIPTVVGMIYIGYSAYQVQRWKNENKLEISSQREQFNRLSILPLVPCTGAILQILLQGAPCVFPCTTLALLMDYVGSQNSQMSRDHLTGLYNRKQLETFMNYQMRNLKKGQYFFLIMMDLDKFKGINDTYGHVIGDEALIHAAKILRSSCKRKSDYVARLGGDEFVIIGQCADTAVVDQMVERIYAAADEFNQTSGKPYEILFSAGYTIYDGTTEATLDSLIKEADKEMYKVKNAKKAARA